MGETYAAAGVDIDAGEAAVERLKSHVESTTRPEVIGGIGGFGGLFDVSSLGYDEPVLVSGTDGVGTKALVATAAGRYDTIGIDLVAMCVDDLVCGGAEPLFFLDYVSVGKVAPEHVEALVSGIADGCRQVGAALIGGEIAEHAGVMGDGEFDLNRVVDTACSDLDGDGLPDVWEQQYFSNPTNATASGHGDGDTLNNRAEYIAGTIPTSGSSVFEVSNVGNSPSGFVLNWTAIEGRAYSVLWTDSLTNNFQTLESNITHPQNSYTDTVHSAEAGGFYNLKVELEN